MKQPELSFQEVEELLPSYVLGSLEAEEMLAVDDYLEAQTELSDKLIELEAENLPSGFYIVKVHSQGTVYERKVAVDRRN